eukprot:1161084-Pelagomonas_calceolata.AAC.7
MPCHTGLLCVVPCYAMQGAAQAESMEPMPSDKCLGVSHRWGTHSRALAPVLRLVIYCVIFWQSTCVEASVQQFLEKEGIGMQHKHCKTQPARRIDACFCMPVLTPTGPGRSLHFKGPPASMHVLRFLKQGMLSETHRQACRLQVL